jgi:hypothetical protein
VATAHMIDFRKVKDHKVPLPVKPRRTTSGKALVMSPKQLRERARRSKKGTNSEDFEILYRPVEEWDAEELARGRPRDRNGKFTGRAPAWITRELHEESMTRFRSLVRDGMNANTNIAIETIKKIMESTEMDDDGRPLVNYGTKLDAAKYLIDHTLGKPKQRVETDISVRLQGMLASTIITPGMLPAMPGAKELTSPRDGVIDVPGWEDDDD